MSDKSSGCGSSGNISGISDSELDLRMMGDIGIGLGLGLLHNKGIDDDVLHAFVSDSEPESDRASNSDDSGDGGSGVEADGENDNDVDGIDKDEKDVNGSVEGGTGGNPFYFEGVEKLLEIWFTRLDGKVGEVNGNLRKIPRYELEEMLKLVHCEIITSVSNDEIDSYVLSESSLFVSQRRIILKTCGTTTPLQCLKFLWTLVKDYTGFDCIEDVYYSHKNYKRPHMQKQPYRKFDNEVAILDDFFRGAEGSAYCLGSMNRDCWYLYTYHHPLSTKNVHHGLIQRVNNLNHHGLTHHCSQHHHHHNHNSHHVGKKQAQGGNRRAVGNSAGRIGKGGHGQQLHNAGHLCPAALQNLLEPDQTLEILMTDLDPKVMEIFTKNVCATAKEATEKSGIDQIIPGMIINDHLFEPCGYSMNGIMKNGTYMTIHITPESEFSYVSFETNISMRSYKELIGRVVDVFRPGKFVLTFFANKVSKGYNAHQEMNDMEAVKDQWLRMDNQFCRLKKNDLTYAMYTKFPS
ncbi:unnamed protein product [Orchesella dallaii]|uniref:Adenosylmethionine decarboxylase n=1 Tax=Orchesella dallaii TaxID=48710 RepID=A0ABP1RLF9_9HEXA